MSRLPSTIASSVCFIYLVLAGLLPAIGLQHDFAVGSDGTPHHAIDTCTWVQHTIGSTACSDAGTDLPSIVIQLSQPERPSQLQRSIQLDSIKARAPPALLS